MKTVKLSNGVEVKVFDDTDKVNYDLSAFYHKACGKHFHADDETEITGSVEVTCCGEKLEIGSPALGLSVFKSSLWLLAKETISLYSLHHATDFSEENPWSSYATKARKDKLFHFGAPEAAEWRIRDRYFYGDLEEAFTSTKEQKFKQYAVSLKAIPETLVLHPDALGEHNELVAKKANTPENIDSSFYLYLNQWEMPGTIALACTNKHFTIVDEITGFITKNGDISYEKDVYGN